MKFCSAASIAVLSCLPLMVPAAPRNWIYLCDNQESFSKTLIDL
ncbi:hypothetical protein BGT96224_40012 [Blumeria graminis f. sp. tritici 96224]|nr:hypothetical protein BGT96224_40012 [Blumeria graminis f. sp. tritici 96224]